LNCWKNKGWTFLLNFGCRVIDLNLTLFKCKIILLAKTSLGLSFFLGFFLKVLCTPLPSSHGLRATLTYWNNKDACSRCLTLYEMEPWNGSYNILFYKPQQQLCTYTIYLWEIKDTVFLCSGDLTRILRSWKHVKQ